MRREIVFTCDICHTPYPTEDLALGCEKQHSDPREYALSGITFGSCKGLTGLNQYFKRRYPDSITLHFSKEPNDKAVYQLRNREVYDN